MTPLGRYNSSNRLGEGPAMGFAPFSPVVIDQAARQVAAALRR